MANNLKDHLKEVADAIRAKKGTNDLINPQDFATEIEGISGGGSGEGGGSNIEYLDVSGLEMRIKGPLWKLAYMRKGYSAINGSDIIAASWPQASESDVEKAVMLSFSDIVMATKEIGFTIPQYCAQLGVTQEQLDAIPRITKEQFYDLNA